MSYYGKTKPSTDMARAAAIRRDYDGARSVRCPICKRAFRVPRGNALGRVNQLRGLLGRHIREKHPEVDAHD